MLTQTLANDNGVSAAGFYINSAEDTIAGRQVAVKLDAQHEPGCGDAVLHRGVARGLPVTRTIQANGNYRKCL